jgi:hypothetical protein
MVIAMNGIEKHAAFYRAYLADERSLASVAGVLMTAVAIWLFFYLVSLVDPQPELQTARSAPNAALVSSQPAGR